MTAAASFGGLASVRRIEALVGLVTRASAAHRGCLFLTTDGGVLKRYRIRSSADGFEVVSIDVRGNPGDAQILDEDALRSGPLGRAIGTGTCFTGER